MLIPNRVLLFKSIFIHEMWSNATKLAYDFCNSFEHMVQSTNSKWVILILFLPTSPKKTTAILCSQYQYAQHVCHNGKINGESRSSYLRLLKALITLTLLFKQPSNERGAIDVVWTLEKLGMIFAIIGEVHTTVKELRESRWILFFLIYQI